MLFEDFEKEMASRKRTTTVVTYPPQARRVAGFLPAPGKVHVCFQGHQCRCPCNDGSCIDCREPKDWEDWQYMI